MSSARGPRIGVWGAFDVPDYGNLLAARICEHELLRRLPHASICFYAPREAQDPIVIGSGPPAVALGDWTPARRAQLAEQLDLMVAVEDMPETAALARRLLSDDTAQRRLRYLRAVGRYPAEKPPLVLETNAAAADAIAEGRAHDPALPIVLAALEPAESEAELAADHELSADVTLLDLVVAIASARAFCGTSTAGVATARAFGVPAAHDIGAVLHGNYAPDPQDDLVEKVDGHFDRLAALAEESWSKGQGPADAAELARALAEAERQHEALLRAYVARGERILAEQERTAELLEALEADDDARARAELAEARNRIEVLDAALAEARDQAQ